MLPAATDPGGATKQEKKKRKGKKPNPNPLITWVKITEFILSFFFYFEGPYPSISAYHNANPLSIKKSINSKTPLCILLEISAYTTAWCIFKAWGTTQTCLKAAELLNDIKYQAASSSYAQLCSTSVKHLRRGWLCLQFLRRKQTLTTFILQKR